jgi:predicted TIM-barrel enzyme
MSTDTPTTRSEHHADSTATQVRASRRHVHRALEAGHVGRERAISGTELAEFVPVKYTTVRDCIAELRDDPDGPPIGNCSDGYYIIDSREELDRYVQSVKDEIQTKRDRLEANTQAFNRRHQ